MGRRSRDAGADTSRCTRAEILTDTGAASHRNLAFTALVQVSRPCLLAFLAWVVEHRPTQGPSLQLAPCRCPFRLTNSRLELTRYNSQNELLVSLEQKVIRPAEAKVKEIRERRTNKRKQAARGTRSQRKRG